MPHLYCGRCGLRIKIQAAYLRIDNCPRCLARNATVTPLALSANAAGPATPWRLRTPDPQRSARTPRALSPRR